MIHINRGSSLLFLLPIYALLLSPRAHALFEEQAGKHDWLKENVGRITLATTTGAKAFVATEANLIAAIDTKRGTVAWRQPLMEEEHVTGLVHHQKHVITLSQPGNIVRVWTSRDGSLVWASNSRAAPKETAHLSTKFRLRQQKTDTEKGFLSASLSLAQTPDGGVYICVFYDGLVTAWDFQNAVEAWTMRLDDNLNNGAHFLTTGRKGKELIAMVESKGKALLWSLNPSTGATSGSKEIPLKAPLTTDTAKAVAGGFLILDQGERKVQFASVGATLSVTATEKIGAVDTIQASPKSDVLVLHGKKGSELLSLAALPNNIKSVTALDLPESATSKRPAFGFVKGSGNTSGRLSIVRAYSTTDSKLHASVYNIEDNSEESVASGVPFPSSQSGSVDLIWAQYLKKSAQYRVLLVSETNMMAAAQRSASGLLWKREEALASVLQAQILPLPIITGSKESAGKFPGFLERLRIQAEEVTSAVSELVGNPAGLLNVEDDETDPLKGDYFGLQKLVVVLTKPGVVFAIGSRDGSIVWTTKLQSGKWAGMATVNPGLLVFYSRDGDVAAVKALTGAIVSESKIQKMDVVSKLPLYTSGYWLLERGGAIVRPDASHAAGAGRFRLMLSTNFDGEKGQSVLIPPTEDAVELFESYSDRVYMHQVSLEQDAVSGFAVVTGDGKKGTYPLERIWTVRFPHGFERISDVSVPDPDSPIHSAVASMGDGRPPKRKYLNPNIIAVATVRSGAGASSTKRAVSGNLAKGDLPAVVLYLIDGVTGKILVRVAQKNGHGPAHVVISENLAVMHYFNAKGNNYEVTCVELFEDPLRAAKADAEYLHTALDGDSVATPPFSSARAPLPAILQHTFIFAHSVRFLDVAGTRMGITSKLILAGLSSHQLAGIGRKLLDTRRPTGEEALTKEQMAEGIVPYHPVLTLDPKGYPSYNQTILQLRGSISSQTYLESTSLVFAYGVDLFFTRVTASGAFDLLSSEFNRIFLVGTVSIVFVILAVTYRWSRQKRLKLLWS
eukprot:CAMPEP_0114525814 /NCGR_PEP_ID=MMETSP0109-20121206/22647_1 /TAXON_ID=29199 /ORGANISM="Chlorarachnion reptans, Strain CCCM449" /LENGTH=1014 /DNA_ID=CAMNT_0001707465 /DNA_START=145 /DNA_END=3189 /DNA_ORIENTATION=-